MTVTLRAVLVVFMVFSLGACSTVKGWFSDDDDDAYDSESGIVEIKMNLEDVLANSTLKDEDRTHFE